MSSVNAFFQVTKLEIRRIIRSYRFLILLLSCTLPMFLYLDLFTPQQSVSVALQGEKWFKIRSLQVFVFFALCSIVGRSRGKLEATRSVGDSCPLAFPFALTSGMERVYCDGESLEWSCLRAC